MDKEVVKEYLQFKLSGNLRTEICKLLENKEYRQTMLDNYQQLANKIGEPGTSDRVALSMYKYLTN